MDAYANGTVISLYDGRSNRVSNIQSVRKDQGIQPIAIHFGCDALGHLREVDALGRTVQNTQYSSVGQRMMRVSMYKSAELSLGGMNDQHIYVWDQGPQSQCRMVYNQDQHD
ncbi:hypothetical protein ACHAPI_012166 [Fusarium lateritium]